jgi:hypothetical protein
LHGFGELEQDRTATVAVDQRPGGVALIGREALEHEGRVGRVQAVQPGFELFLVLARNPGELPRPFGRLLFRRLFALGLLALHERLDLAQRRLERRVVFDFRLHGRDFAQSPCGRQ